MATGEGRARHSVRAVVADQGVLVGKGRRAEDCPPYLRRCVNFNVNCYMPLLTELEIVLVWASTKIPRLTALVEILKSPPLFYPAASSRSRQWP